MKNTFKSAAMLLAMAGVAPVAMAQSTWNWGASPGCDPVTCTVNGIKSTVTGYGATNSTSTLGAATVLDIDPYGLGLSSAGGTESTASPHHAIDNSAASGGAFEFVAISFTNATTNAAVGVNLSKFTAGWTYSDSDALIYRWDGANAPSFGITPGSLPTTVGTTAGSWTLVSSGNFGANGAIDGNTAGLADLNVNSAKYSSWWLVSTGSSADGVDGFKLRTFAGSYCSGTTTNGVCTPGNINGVPEPVSLALFGIAALGAGVARRRSLTK